MCTNSKISQRYFLNALFLNIMKFISPFYDENCRRSMDLKYKLKRKFWEMKEKQKKFLSILALSLLLPQRQGYYPHSVGVYDWIL